MKNNLVLDDDKFQELVENYIKKRIESWKLRLELSNLKAEIVNHKLITRDSDNDELDFDYGKLFIKKSEIFYSKFFNKDFKNLTNEEKRKLFKSWLIKVLFRLDQKKYQDLKNQNIKTPLDKFVIESKDKNPYEIKLEYADKIKDEIKNLKASLIKILTLKEADKALAYLEELYEEYQQIEEERYESFLEDLIIEDDDFEGDVRKEYD